MTEVSDDAWLPALEIVRAITEFKPDPVVILDHHRREFPQRSVSNVPFLCWIQGDLPELFNAPVGPEFTEYDFTIGYPADGFMPCRMAIDPSKLARRGDAPADSGR